MIDSTCARAHQHGTTAKKGIIRSRHGRALSPGAPLPANSMLLSTLRDVLSACEAEALIADIPNGANRKQRFGFSAWLYRQRNLVERFFNRIKQFRGIATRYDKDPANFLAAFKLVCTRIGCTASKVYILITQIMNYQTPT